MSAVNFQGLSVVALIEADEGFVPRQKTGVAPYFPSQGLQPF
jgi:hypothetical protein